MKSTRDRLLASDFPAVARKPMSVLQVNLGYTCNQSCSHCHVNAGPHRSEQMDRKTIDLILQVIECTGVTTVDLTGGAPELNPGFVYLVGQARVLGAEVIDRCNLTILMEPGFKWLAPFLADSRVTVVASLPCYGKDNVEEQRGKGVFEPSIRALQLLNDLGYGKGELKLNLVYNPNGSFLPPSQKRLEADYKRELFDHFGIVFDELFTLTNMPISRFGAVLLARGEFDRYMALLRDSFSAANLDTLMCRNTISVDWRGYLYDCDFNQMLALPIEAADGGLRGRPMHAEDLLSADLSAIPVRTASHCYGCTAGQGSSCGGALN